jgi:phosphatidylglycerophosphatase A
VKDQNNTFLDKLYLIYLSWFGTGYSPFAPGTIGSIATIPLIYLFSILKLNFYLFLVLLLIATISTCLITEVIQKKYQVHDPSWIVADEVLGMLVTWCFIYPQFDPYSATLVLLIFRVFDIIKIWPASYFDKKVHHGSGTILDDIISGIYAGLIILIAKNYFTII